MARTPRRQPPDTERPKITSREDLNTFLDGLAKAQKGVEHADAASTREAVRTYLQQFDREKLQGYLDRAFADALKSPGQKLGTAKAPSADPGETAQPTGERRKSPRARASLELIERLRGADVKVGHERIPVPAVRTGAHTGLVVIGPEHASAGQKLQSAVGGAVNLAARSPSEAPPNSVVVTGETQLLEGAFETEPLGTKSINGLSRIVPVSPDQPKRSWQRRMRGRLPRGSAHVVRRTGELERIVSYWGEVSRNGRCTVVVVDEAGIGKTRVVVEFRRRAELNKANILQVNCHEIFANTPFYGIHPLLWSCIGPAGDDDETVEIQNLSAFLDQIGINSSDNLEIAASSLGRALTSKMDEIAPMRC